MKRSSLALTGSVAALSSLAVISLIATTPRGDNRVDPPTLLIGAKSTDSPEEHEPTVEPPGDTADETLSELHIVLDPGHNSENASRPDIVGVLVDDGRGGLKACNTTGTATLDGYPEYEFNYDIAQRVQTQLNDAGATVSLTREETGVGPCVDVRGQMAGEIGADVLISIHANGSESPEPHGYFAIVSGDPLYPAQGEPSQILADFLITELDSHGFTPSTVFGPLTYRDDLATINHSTVPVVMVELAEFRNPDEAHAVTEPEVRQHYADALVDGVMNWWAVTNPSDGD